MQLNCDPSVRLDQTVDGLIIKRVGLEHREGLIIQDTNNLLVK